MTALVTLLTFLAARSSEDRNVLIPCERIDELLDYVPGTYASGVSIHLQDLYRTCYSLV